MSKDLDNRYFITLNKDKIIFSCLNKENKISFTMSHILENGLNNLFEDLEKFFIDNLINIEKSLKDFIRKIYIILDTDDSLSAHLSIKYKLETEKINDNKINELLSYLKNQFNKYSNDQKIIHMTIIKVLIDGKEEDLSLAGETFDNLILEIKFECLKNQTVHFVKKLCSNYQISVEKILLANYLRYSFLPSTENLAQIAIRSIYGVNKNEIKIVKKKLNKKSFLRDFFIFLAKPVFYRNICCFFYQLGKYYSPIWLY
jgi:hypothetical protein